MRNLSDAVLQLELEKAQRLVQMIETEIRWRRTLELEEKVRKEMIIEREIAMRRANGLGYSLEALPALPQESCFALLGLNAFNMAHPAAAEINPVNMKRESEGIKEKLIVLHIDLVTLTHEYDTIMLRWNYSIFQPKPNKTRYEGKRKAGEEEKNSENDDDGFMFEFKKKAKEVKVVEESRCELCNIVTTSDKSLNDHFKGKKHMAKEKTQNWNTVSQMSTNSGVSKSEMEEEEVDDGMISGLQSVKKH